MPQETEVIKMLPPVVQPIPVRTMDEKLLAISPIDGRYADRSEKLRPYLSEWGLMRARIFVEGELFRIYAEEGLIDPLTQEETAYLDTALDKFDLASGAITKDFEKRSDHDVVAIVKFMQEDIKKHSLPRLLDYLHFGPTSEDIDNIAWRLMIDLARREYIIPTMTELNNKLISIADEAKDCLMIGRTHGQPAGVTTFGRELLVFASRLQDEIDKTANHQFTGKFNGIIGTYSGQRTAFPEKDVEWWLGFSQKFARRFGLDPELITTQGNPNDDLAEFLQIQVRTNNIIHGLAGDTWEYIKDKLLHQKITGSGSSTGAAKVNPWRVEHVQAMLEIANGMAYELIRNIQEYKLQRDLSDKTLMRFLPEITALQLNAIEYMTKQLELVTPNKDGMAATIDQDWSFLSEALQLTLRKGGIEKGYEVVRKKLQGRELPPPQWAIAIEELITELDLRNPEHQELARKIRSISPAPFITDAIELTKLFILQLKKRQQYAIDIKSP
ncbi:hypothetical protein A3D78_00015 [Candidatus Gottesmanbacteria bacterium RIFCSPHIGHO2_02_FULL_39_14]|uniref:Adenylosuccinate lyase n=1 Tax=Candidatus Gottesmanbacteria bacterium RIFCSPHIGHO2_02_FULL_39_14 TaxID=1798383 RepID=A0A1F6A2K6_9BACT|nr:MAG: hypothetical protein A3D78_00015 [Candidatus Gottesmanbacteria bacterium RIFCSPHIGHO2_02_FULL_39_14]